MNPETKITGTPSANEVFNRYQRVFGQAGPTTYGEDDLRKLAESMTSASNPFIESNIPSGYTYLGQFLNHEISKPDPATRGRGLGELKNLHTPFIDLQTLYGNGPDKNPELYETDVRLRLSDTSGGIVNVPYDLPRKAGSCETATFDKRSDENLALAQLHVLLIKFHNAMASFLVRQGSGTFDAIRDSVIRHFQSMVIYDYLASVLYPDVYQRLLKGERRIFSKPTSEIFVPAEFAMAAFRFGHAMIRPSYFWNRFSNPATIDDLFSFTGNSRFTFCNTGDLRTLPGLWGIDWRRFFDVAPGVEVNKARGISPYLSTKLGKVRLLAECVKDPPTFSLAEKDLGQGLSNSLENGQTIAKALGLKPLTMSRLPAGTAQLFANETPLFYYILDESMSFEAGRLGPVGSWIVGETIFELISRSPISIINDRSWKSINGKLDFSVSELLRLIVNEEGNNWNAINPNG